MKKKIFAILFVFGAFLTGFAQDFGFGDDFGFGEDSSLDSFGGENSSPISISGMASFGARAYFDGRDSDDEKLSISDWGVAVFPQGKLNFNYSGSSTDAEIKLKLDKFSLGGYYWDILDEFSLRAYMGNAQLSAGKMRVVWGKCDKIHVLDNFNANDYTDFIIPDYIERRIAEPMFRFTYTTNNNITFDAVYAPVMTPDRLADSGVWRPKAMEALEGIVKNTLTSEKGKLGQATKEKDEKMAEVSVLATMIKNLEEAGGRSDEEIEDLNEKLKSAKSNLATAETNYLLALNEVSSFDADSLYPDTYKLKYGQAGLRSTFTVGPVDFGVSYYYGHYKQPSVSLQRFLVDSVSLPELEYDRLQVFGFEMAGILFGKLNSRLEFAYNLTEDVVGDDPFVHNNSIAWVGGFDVDLPISNININIQNQGKYILGANKIDDGDGFKKYSPVPKLIRGYDVDYDGNHCYSNNKIILDITDSYKHESIKLDIKSIWGIERGDLVILPSVSFKIKDDFTLDLSGMYIWCRDDDSEFAGWENNSYIQIACKYQF